MLQNKQNWTLVFSFVLVMQIGPTKVLCLTHSAHSHDDHVRLPLQPSLTQAFTLCSYSQGHQDAFAVSFEKSDHGGAASPEDGHGDASGALTVSCRGVPHFGVFLRRPQGFRTCRCRRSTATGTRSRWAV
jgi:hypothetical protein